MVRNFENHMFSVAPHLLNIEEVHLYVCLYDSFQLSVFIPISQENSLHMHGFWSCLGVLADQVLTPDGERTGFFISPAVSPFQERQNIRQQLDLQRVSCIGEPGRKYHFILCLAYF